ncbi:hypothetical protein M0R72_16940 [Candidatus Pacearchaeota archaeon]|jgi:hypothetical protein|nr:hypothetical protein [Candidatus Pacearchaeota archaeon]
MEFWVLCFSLVIEMSYKTLSEYGNVPFKARVYDLGSDEYASATVLEGGNKRLVKEFTRPANTTQYSALDCISDAAPSVTTQNLPLAGRMIGGSGSIIRAVMATDNLSWTNGITVHIYDEPPISFIADNAAYDPKYADKANMVGTLAFSAFAKDATGAAGSFVKCVLEGLNMPYECADDSTNLYFQCFLPSGTPTPTSGQKFYLNIGVMRD